MCFWGLVCYGNFGVLAAFSAVCEVCTLYLRCYLFGFLGVCWLAGYCLILVFGGFWGLDFRGLPDFLGFACFLGFTVFRAFVSFLDLLTFGLWFCAITFHLWV